jgi:hypothetical protein
MLGLARCCIGVRHDGGTHLNSNVMGVAAIRP